MNTMPSAKHKKRNNGWLAGWPVVLSGLAFALNGLALMFNAFGTGSGFGLPVLLVIVGALICAIGGFLSGRSYEQNSKSTSESNGDHHA